MKKIRDVSYTWRKAVVVAAAVMVAVLVVAPMALAQMQGQLSSDQASGQATVHLSDQLPDQSSGQSSALALPVQSSDQPSALALSAQDMTVEELQDDHASVSLVQELVGRTWVSAGGAAAGGKDTLPEGDSFTFSLVPVGKAKYADGQLVTIDGPQKDAAGTAYKVIDRQQGLQTDESGVVVTDIPLPQKNGTEVDTLTITAADVSLSTSQRSAAFGQIQAVESDLQTIGDAEQIDYFYDLVQRVPDDALATNPATGDAVLFTQTAVAGGVTYTPIPTNADEAAVLSAQTLTYAQATANTTQDFVTDAYAWRSKGVTYTGETHEVRVRFVKRGTAIVPHVSYDGRPYGAYVPVFANTYDAKGRSWAHIVTHLDGRDFTSDDRFSYGITNVGGSIMRPTDGTQGDVSLVTMTHITHPMQLESSAGANDGYGVHFASDQRINQEVDGGEMAILTGEGTFHSYDLNETGEGLFVYAVTQYEQVTADQNAGFTVSKAADLDYDARTIYLRYRVTDNADGTLQVVAHYYTNAACTVPLTVGASHTVPSIWVNAKDGTPLDNDSIARAESIASASTDDSAKEAALAALGFAKMDTAYFRNIRTVDVPVRNVWNGMPVEDVSVHLERALFDASWSDDRIEAFAEDADTGSTVTWERIGLTTVLARADVLDPATGMPRYAEGTTKAAVTYGSTDINTDVNTDGSTGVSTDGSSLPAIAGFNAALPMYIVDDASITHRAAYRLVEDDTSDAYDPGYYSEENGVVKQGDNIFVDSGTLVIENKVVATNYAHIAAVSQLIGRTWLDSDAFSYKLEPLGRATYDAQGEMICHTEDGKVVAALEEGSAAAIPMPEAPHTDAPAGTDANVAFATLDTSSVAVGEHLARFGAIYFDTSQLVYDPEDFHLQGDFFYRMTALAPSTSSGGITYDAKESIVHVRVRENRTNTLEVSVAYDETNQANVATGTQFTPVFTHYYDIAEKAQVTVNSHIMGRDWRTGDALDFTLRAMSGAAFVPWDTSQQIRLDHNGKAEDGQGVLQDENYWMDKGKQVVTRDGALRMRLVPTADQVGTQEVLEASFASMRFELDDLHYTVGENGAKDERDISDREESVFNDNGVAATGLRYGRFMYAVSQSAVHAEEADLLRDEDTEYAQVLVVDNGDGTFALSVTIFEDRYASIPRYTPRADNPGIPSTDPAAAVTFTNQATHDLEVRKDWVGVATSDAAIQLQSTTAQKPTESDWHDVADATIVFQRDGMQATNDGLTATSSFVDLPLYLRDDDDLDLNDAPLLYRVREVTGTGFTPSYSQVSKGEQSSVESAVPLQADLNKTQIVTNISSYDSRGEAFASVVVELTGRPWLSSDASKVNYTPALPEGDRFLVELSPLGKADVSAYYTEETAARYNAQNSEAIEQGSKEAVSAGDLRLDKQGMLPLAVDAEEDASPAFVRTSTAPDAPVDTRIPSPSNSAFAQTEGESSAYISASQRLAAFDTVQYSLADMNNINGFMEADFFYSLAMCPPDDATAWLEQGSGSDAQTVQVSANDVVFGKDGAATEPLCYKDATDAQKTRYQWRYLGVTFDTQQHIARVHIADRGRGSFTPVVTYDGDRSGHAVPVLVNTYDARGGDKSYVMKHIEGRSWQDSDAFEFCITAVGGSVMNLTDDAQGGWTSVAVQTCDPLRASAARVNAAGDRALMAGEAVYRLADLAPATETRRASGRFVYQIQEVDPSHLEATAGAVATVSKVPDLYYDPSVLYMRVTVTDNLDGTLDTRNEYFLDAACTSPQINDVGNPYMVWVDDEGSVVDVANQSVQGVATKSTAYFENRPAATGTARVAAVEQLLGRSWMDATRDRRTVELRPLGRATYTATGAIDTRDALRNGEAIKEAVYVDASGASIPMPEDDPVSGQRVVGTGAERVATATATRDTDVVGDGERLARFGNIFFKADDLVYNVAERRRVGDFYYRMTERIPQDTEGITYDNLEHLVHVSVREVASNILTCYVYYDETDASQPLTGTQFTPVFTLQYSALSSVPVAVSSTLRGRDWLLGEYFDYELRPMGGAPFVYPTSVVRLDHNGQDEQGRNEAYHLAAGDAIATRMGVLKMRLANEVGASGSIPLEGTFPDLTFAASNLMWNVGEGGTADPADAFGERLIWYSDDWAQEHEDVSALVPEGMAYGKFTYAVNQAVGANEALTYDTSTEYAQVLVIDKGDGTLDISVHIYDDRYGQIPRYDAGNGLPVTAAQFVNVDSSSEFKTVRAKIAWQDASGASVTEPANTLLMVPLLLTGTNDDGDPMRIETATLHKDEVSRLWETSWSVPRDYHYELSAGLVEGYTVESCIEGGSADVSDYTLTLKEMPAPVADSMTVSVQTKWVDGTNHDNLRNPYTVQLQQRSGSGTWAAADVSAAENGNDASVEVDSDTSSLLLQWTEVPTKATDGTPLSYRVVAQGTPEGYTSQVAQTSAGEYSVVCAHAVQTVAVRLHVEWLDLESATRPAAAKFALYADGEELQGLEHEVVAADGGNWTYVWYNLPAYKNYTLVDYTVAFLTGAYDSLLMESSDKGNVRSFTVGLLDRQASKSVHARVEWHDAQGRVFTPGASAPTPAVTLQLIKRVGGTATLVSGADKSIAANTAGTAVWQGLDAYDKTTGQEISYSVTQKGISGYSYLYVPEQEIGGALHAAIVNRANGDPIYGLTITSPSAPTAQALKVVAKAKTIKASVLKKKAVTVKGALKVTGAKTALSYKVIKVSKKKFAKKFTISKKGMLKVKKGVPKGTYNVKIKVTAKATSAYKAATKTVVLKVKVK